MCICKWGLFFKSFVFIAGFIVMTLAVNAAPLFPRVSLKVLEQAAEFPLLFSFSTCKNWHCAWVKGTCLTNAFVDYNIAWSTGTADKAQQDVILWAWLATTSLCPVAHCTSRGHSVKQESEKKAWCLSCWDTCSISTHVTLLIWWWQQVFQQHFKPLLSLLVCFMQKENNMLVPQLA